MPAKALAGDRHARHRDLPGSPGLDRPTPPAAAALWPRRPELLHDQDPLGVVLPDQVAPLRQADLARQLQLDEGGSRYRGLGRGPGDRG